MCLRKKTASTILTEAVEMAGRVGFEPTVECYPDNHLAGGPNRPLWHLPGFNYQFSMNINNNCSLFIVNCKELAEGEGFEPPETLRPQWFSRPPQSSTLPSLQAGLSHILAETEWKVNSFTIQQLYYYEQTGDRAPPANPCPVLMILPAHTPVTLWLEWYWPPNSTRRRQPRD